MKSNSFLSKIAVYTVLFAILFWSVNLPLISDNLLKVEAATGEGDIMFRVNFMSGRDRVSPGSLNDFEFELNVGTSGIAADQANIRIEIPAGFSAPQSSSSTSAGYVTVESSNGSAEMVASTTGQSIDIIASGTPLISGDIVWIGYGSTNANANGASLSSTSTGNYDFTVLTDDTGGNNRTEVSGSPFNVTVESPIVLSEIQVNGAGTATNEFVEIYNNSNNVVSLAGWDIAYGAATATSSILWATSVSINASSSLQISPYGYVLFASNGYSPEGVTADISHPSTGLGFASTGGYISVRDGGNNVIDYVGYGTLTAEALAEGGQGAENPGNISIERKAFGNSTVSEMATGGLDETMGNGWDTNNNMLDFVVLTTSVPQNGSSANEQAEGSMPGGGPMIMHMPINIAPTGSDLILTAQMGDPQTDITQLGTELKYMIGDGTPTDNIANDYSTVTGVSQSNGYFQFTIPQAIIDASTSSGLYYFLKVVGDGGTMYMSASPQADMSGDIAQVAQNPFIVTVEDSGNWVTHDIAGTISDESGDPIENAFIFIEGTNYTATSAANGTYTLSGVRDGIHNIIITKAGYYDEWIMDIYLSGVNLDGVNRSLYAGTGGGMTGDNEKPYVTWTGPPDGMFGVPPGDENFDIFIGLSKDVDSSTFISANVYLTTDGSTPISSTVAYDNVPGDNPAQMRPTDNYLGIVSPPTGGFVADTTYYLIMTGNIRDTAGNALLGNRSAGGHEISFTTGGDYSSGGQVWDDFGTGDMQPPFVMGTVPSNGQFGVAPNTKVIIDFAEPLMDSTVNSTNIKLYAVTYSGTTEIETAVSLSSIALDTTKKIVTLTPTSNLGAAKYKIVVTGAIESASGVFLGDPSQNQHTSSYQFYSSYFEVDANTSADATAPTILGTWPANATDNIPVSPGSLSIQFSEGMSPGSINSNTITLKRGSTKVNSTVAYDSMSKSATLIPSVVLAVNTDYTLTIEGNGTSSTASVQDVVGNAMTADAVAIFTTTATGDTQAPAIMFANGDDFGIAITFTEPMNGAKITDGSNYAKSVLNPANYLLKYGDPGTDFSSEGTVIDISNARLDYDGMTNTIIIEDLGVDSALTLNKDYFVNLATSTVTVGTTSIGVADLSGNFIAAGTSTSEFVTPVQSSSVTNGMLGPNMGGSMGPDMGNMGMMMSGVFPMNAMAGQSTIYFVDLPTSAQILDGYSIVLTFPQGFDVSGAKKDPYSPLNNDINEWNSGTISFKTDAESSGGANNDGVVVDAAARRITINLAVTGTAPTNDFLRLDIAGIVNSSIPRDYDTSGYTVDMKILKADGSLSETIANGMPFFINSGGSSDLQVVLAGIQSADVDGSSDEVQVFLGSPMTGPMEMIIAVNTDGNGTGTLVSLPAGDYMLFTDPNITLDNNDYSGMSMPEYIYLGAGTTTKTVTLSKQAAGAGLAEITVTITGVFGTDNIDIFAGSPTGFRVKTIVNAGTNPTTTSLFLGDGEWMVGMGPAMPKGPMAGPPPMPDWMPPMPTLVKISDNGSTVTESSGTANDGAVVFTVSNAGMEIIGYVKDDSDVAIADAEVWAYQPMGFSMGAHTKTDTDGKFTLKLSAAGNYTVGTFKSGLPFVPEKPIVLQENTGGAVDGNATADVYFNNTLITAANLLEFKIKKPSYTISGKVTDGTNSVSYAPVWADTASGQGHVDTMTDSSGNYILYVDNGTWNINAYIPGFGDADVKTVVVNGANMTQNLSPDSTITYCSIAGTVTIDGTLQTYMPIRAMQFDDNAYYTGKEYGGQTASDGTYLISVPCSNKYRVDIWTPDYGEVELDTDEVADSPANIVIVSIDVTGKDITIAAGDLRTITINTINATSTQSGYLNIDGVTFASTSSPPIFNGFHKSIRFDDLTATNTVLLANGDYFFFLDVPGYGGYIPDSGSRHADKDDIEVTATTTVNFTLPDLSGSDMVNITGIITDGSDPVTDAWVWVGNPSTGYHTGSQANASGTYALTVPAGTGYVMGADKPGYMSEDPIDLTASGTMTQNFTLTAATLTISGRIYTDTNSDGNYDSGEEIANGFVRAETADNTKKSHAPADGSGYYEIGVVNGEWEVLGMAPGYQETEYTANVTISGSSATVNIILTIDSGWENLSKMKPITPASGGSMDDTTQDTVTGKKSGTGVKITVPPNALGNSTAAGNINSNVTTAIKTNSFEPLGDKGINITATDNSGQSITTLNDYIDLEMVQYKADIEASITNNEITYTQLKSTNNGYWDATVNDWVKLTTIRNAYYKGVGDTEWTLHSSTTASSSFEAFVDTLPGSYDDYKLVYISKTNHLTIFGTITNSDIVAPAAVSGFALGTAGNGSVSLNWSDNTEDDLLEYQVFRGSSSGLTCNDASQINTSAVSTSAYTDSAPTANASYTYYYKVAAVDNSSNISTCSSAVTASYTYTAPAPGGSPGGFTAPSCTAVTYGDWGNCADGTKYRDVLSKTPTNCALTTAQTEARSMSCSLGEELAEEVTVEEVAEEIIDTVAEIAIEFAQKIVTITNEAVEVAKANINSFLAKFGYKRELNKEIQGVRSYVRDLIKDMKDITKNKEYALTNFVTYGTETTQILGEGERAGVINSYKAAFGKLPGSAGEWSDVIKIANGRWPNERNLDTERNAIVEFERIYKRMPVFSNPHDDAAVKVIAYGLRPTNRNLDSEKVAIKTFKAIYRYNPSSATAWDIVRAIAYSGATR